MATSPSNGISEKTPVRIQLSLVIFVIVTVATAAVAYAKVQGHCDDCGIHHALTELDARYPQTTLVDQRFADLQRTADRIEAKLDRMLEKRP